MIGIFDSGIGGLTVAREIIRRLPDYDIVYFGDTARTPYGDKSLDIIKNYTLEDIDFLMSRGAKLIVAACHSSSIVAHENIHEESRVPLFDMITPTAAAAVAATRSGRIGILGTRATVNSHYYEQAIEQLTTGIDQSKVSENFLKMPAFTRKHKSALKTGSYQVFSQAAPLLVPLVEEGWLDKPETKRIVKHYLRPLKEKNIDTLILACTHYPLLKKLIEPRIGSDVKVIDPGHEVAQALEKFLINNPEIEQSLSKTKKRHYLVSDISPHFEKVATRWLGHPIKLELAKI